VGELKGTGRFADAGQREIIAPHLSRMTPPLDQDTEVAFVTSVVACLFEEVARGAGARLPVGMDRGRVRWAELRSGTNCGSYIRGAVTGTQRHRRTESSSSRALTSERLVGVPSEPHEQPQRGACLCLGDRRHPAVRDVNSTGEDETA